MEYNLCNKDRPPLTAFQRHLPKKWIHILKYHKFVVKHNNWIEIFTQPKNELPEFVYQASPRFKPQLHDDRCDVLIPNFISRYSVGMYSCQLQVKPQLQGRILAQYEFSSFIRKLCIVLAIVRGQNKLVFNLYAGQIINLDFDPTCWK